MKDGIDRRIVLRRLLEAGLILGGGGLLAALGLRSKGRWAFEPSPVRLKDRRVPSEPSRPPLAVAMGDRIPVAVRAAVDAVGGIGRFVRRGETVLVKPNMAWDRTPEQGANTHPEVIEAVVLLCREAGAARVIVTDMPVNDAIRVATRSGIAEAARRAGAEFVLPREGDLIEADLSGSVLGRWGVLPGVVSADRIVNVPVVKDHGLTRLTCGLKNNYGFLGGTRARLHQKIHASIVDLAEAIRPTLTVVDATRVMVRGGPTGGRVSDVRRVDAVAAGTDPVALDAWGAGLLGVDAREIPYIVLAEGRGLGSIAAGSGRVEAIHAGA